MDEALRAQMLAHAEALVNALATWAHDHPDADFTARETLVLGGWVTDSGGYRAEGVTG